MTWTAADEVWNRAIQHGGGSNARAGDRALSALLSLHSLAMNGGVHHAMDCLSAEEVADAIAGYAWFGFGDVAEWLDNAADDPLLKAWTDDTEWPALARYLELIPDDAALVARFEAVYRERPEAFAEL